MWFYLFNEKRYAFKKVRYGTINSLAYIMNNRDVVNIDTKRDFEFAEFLMNKNEI